MPSLLYQKVIMPLLDTVVDPSERGNSDEEQAVQVRDIIRPCNNQTQNTVQFIEMRFA
jgi:hypothetical protein